jgi:hypothetical protein
MATRFRAGGRLAEAIGGLVGWAARGRRRGLGGLVGGAAAGAELELPKAAVAGAVRVEADAPVTVEALAERIEVAEAVAGAGAARVDGDAAPIVATETAVAPGRMARVIVFPGIVAVGAERAGLEGAALGRSAGALRGGGSCLRSGVRREMPGGVLTFPALRRR